MVDEWNINFRLLDGVALHYLIFSSYRVRCHLISTSSFRKRPVRKLVQLNNYMATLRFLFNNSVDGKLELDVG